MADPYLRLRCNVHIAPTCVQAYCILAKLRLQHHDTSPLTAKVSVSESAVRFDEECRSLFCYAELSEVVGVGPGGKRSVLARVSIVDYFGQCLLDRYVKVEERVTDYRHHVTGICAKDLSSASAVSFGKCRQQVISLMRGKVLVGHALENDLSVLGIHHPWHDIRDTSIYYPYQKKDRYGRIGPSRLCHLAKIHLGIDIQKKGQPHCPVEDACAAMALYRKNQPFWDSLVDSQRCNMLNV